MSFLRIKTIDTRQYLYEETRGSGGYQKSKSLGRIGFGFWYCLGVLLNNLMEPNAFSLEQYYAEEDAARRDIEQREAEKARLAEVIDPTTYDTKPEEVSEPDKEVADPSDSSESSEPATTE